jgi:outer membrane protein W
MKKLLLSTLIASSLTSSAIAFTQDFVLKGRGGMVQIDSSIKTSNRGTTATQETKDGWLGELALDYLFTRNVAFEVSAGYGLFKVKNKKDTKKSSTFVPLTGTVMFRLPMYNKFFPYVGAGYSYKIFSAGPTGTSIDNSKGFVLQAGTDIFFDNQDTSSPIGLNIDLKYYLKSESTISDTVSGATEKFKNKMSQFTILGGVVVPF